MARRRAGPRPSPRGQTPVEGSGLPLAIERRAMRRYGSGAGGRIGTAAALRAIAVLLRRHPKAAIDMAGAGLWAAGRVGLSEMSHWLAPAGPGRAGRKPKAADRLSNRDRRRLRKLLERERDSAER